MGQVPSTPAQGPPFDNALDPNIDYTFDIDNGLRVQDSDSNTAWEFAIAVMGIIVFFTIWHWSRHFALKGAFPPSSGSSPGPRFLVAPSRLARKYLIPKLKGFTSRGHAIVVIVYIAINLVLLFTHLDWALTSNFARRLGWVCTINITFTFFLALKLQPLGFLTGYTYERLNILHQIVGYTTVILALMHTLVFVASRNQEGLSYNLDDVLQRPGIIAALVMIVIAITSLTMRKRYYDAFYVIHVIAAILILITVYRHRPYIQTRTAWIVLAAAIFLVNDKLFRWARYAWNFRGTRATLHPLLNNGTRILLNKSSKKVNPGEHIWLWLPGVNRTQTHPFTVVNNDPLEIVLAAQTGFTKKVNELANLNPGISVSATWDGPYGKLPHIKLYNRIVLVAGGSGGSWTIPLAMAILDNLHADSDLQMDFIWVVRTNETLSWFPTPLARLAASPHVNLILYTTNRLVEPMGEPSAAYDTTTEEPLSEPAATHIKGIHLGTLFKAKGMKRAPAPTAQVPLDRHTAAINGQTPSSSTETKEAEVVPATVKTEIVKDVLPPSSPGRPNVASLITEVMAASRGNRCLVGVCGPPSMVKDARRGVGKGMGASGGGVELWIEEYGW